MRKRSTFAASLATAGLLASAAPALAAELSALRGGDLRAFDSAAPATGLRVTTITGLNIGQRLIGIDARPASPRVLYGMSSDGQLYAVNAITGGTTAIGLRQQGFNTGQIGFDFNPSVDRIRLVTDGQQNFRLNPDTGALAAVDGLLAYAPGDPNFGRDRVIVGAAYTNNVPGGTPTTLYVVDAGNDVLATQGSVNGAPTSPNGGQLFTVGSLGLDTSGAVGFDISRTGEVVASFTNPTSGVTSLYSVNLGTGSATLIGALPDNATYTGLAFTQPSIESLGQTPNSAAIGRLLDRYPGGLPSPELLQFFNAFDRLPSDDDRSAVLASLSPGAFSLLPDLVFQAGELQDVTVRRYLRDVRGGGTDSGGETATIGSDSQIGLFLVGNGRTGSFDGDVDRPRVNYGSTGVVGGADYRFGPTSLIGVFGGYDWGLARLNANSRNSDIETWFAGGYVSLGVGPLYIDAYGSYGQSEFDLRRTIAIGDAFVFGFEAETSSKQYQGGATVGLSFEFAGIEAEPYGGARYINTDIDDFSEGSSLVALTVLGDEVESIQSILGLRLGADIKLGGASLRPSLRGEWRHEFENKDERDLVASFGGTSSGIGEPFAFTTTPLAEDFAAVGAGFTISGDSPISVVVDYSGQIASDRSIHGITGGVRVTF